MKRFLVDKNWNIVECEIENPLSMDQIEILDKVEKVTPRLFELIDLLDGKLKQESKNYEKLFKINSNLEIVHVMLVNIGSIEKCEKAGSFDHFKHVVLENESLCIYEDIFTKIESIRGLLK